MQRYPYTKKLLFLLLSIVVVFLTIHLIVHYINLEIYKEQNWPFYELTNRFDFDDEMSIPTWFSQLLLLITAALTGFRAFLERNSTASRAIWLMLSVAFALGSLDEVAALHESLLRVVHVEFYGMTSPSLSSNAWLIFLPLILSAVLYFTFKIYQVLGKRLSMMFLSGFIVYIAGAAGVDMLNSLVNGSMSRFTVEGLLVAAEEGLELVGTSIVLLTVSYELEKNYHSKITSAIRQLK